jgi:pimeloyl-ACP methyl ester carboxylesterase
MAVKKITLSSSTFDIHYEILNPKNKKDLIILHGWGSNKEIMKQAFGTLLPTFRHIYIDMPGFGKSSNDSIMDTQGYRDVIAHFLEEIGAKRDILMGHSYGGKVATLLEPELLVLLSNSGIPIPKPLSIRLKIKLFKLMKGVLGTSMATLFASKDVQGMPQNMYETFKIVVNEDFTPYFETYPKPTLLFWGKKDTAAPLWSGEKIARLIKKSKIYPLEGDHFFFLHHAPFIADTIQKELHG